jgi:hypothetical protein
MPFEILTQHTPKGLGCEIGLIKVVHTQMEATTVQCRALSTATADSAKEVGSACIVMPLCSDPCGLSSTMLVCSQAVHKTAQSSWAGPAAGAAVVGAGLFYYFTRPAAASASCPFLRSGLAHGYYS